MLKELKDPQTRIEKCLCILLEEKMSIFVHRGLPLVVPAV